MTLSIWKYAHLTFALLSSIFLILASVTGIILAADAVLEKMPSHKVENFEDITLSQIVPGLQQRYLEVTEIGVDHNQHTILKGIDLDGNDVDAYIDPWTGDILGLTEKKSDFIQWITALHRSLFIHETGRFLMGVTAFLLILIALSGVVLVVKRQKGLLRFFSKVVKDYVSQYYHVVLGRLMLIPIFLIAITGTYISMQGFNLFSKEAIKNNVVRFENENTGQKAVSEFELFKNTKLEDVKRLEFPFDAEDPDEVYTLKLNDRELQVNQFSGKIVNEYRYPVTALIEDWSLDLHTGRTNIIWAIVLGIASLNILFFIYSGFAMTLRRRDTKIKNKFAAKESNFLLLAGSKNGSTFRFANAIHTQLLANGYKSYLTGLDNYTRFPEASHIIIFTSTHGLGDAPSNGSNFFKLIERYPQEQKVNVSVVGFGSRAYPDFCKFAIQTEELLAVQSWSSVKLPLHTIDDRSPEQFISWVREWSEITGIPLATTPAYYAQKPASLQKMIVLEKTPLSATDHTFMLTLRTGWKAGFTSGDLLAIYPGGGKERLYSIGRSSGNIQLVVKLHPSGIGSGYLNRLVEGSVIKARIHKNAGFYFPKKAPVVAMISNGTGIAPFLGMIEENKKKVDCHLYCGFRNETNSVVKYKEFAETHIGHRHLATFHLAYSREQNNCYVMDLIRNDSEFFADVLRKGGVIMICGSLAMERDVEEVLDTICQSANGNRLADFKAKGQVLSDCY